MLILRIEQRVSGLGFSPCRDKLRPPQLINHGYSLANFVSRELLPNPSALSKENCHGLHDLLKYLCVLVRIKDGCELSLQIRDRVVLRVLRQHPSAEPASFLSTQYFAQTVVR